MPHSPPDAVTLSAHGLPQPAPSAASAATASTRSAAGCAAPAPRCGCDHPRQRAQLDLPAQHRRSRVGAAAVPLGRRHDRQVSIRPHPRANVTWNVPDVIAIPGGAAVISGASAVSALSATTRHLWHGRRSLLVQFAPAAAVGQHDEANRADGGVKLLSFFHQQRGALPPSPQQINAKRLGGADDA